MVRMHTAMARRTRDTTLNDRLTAGVVAGAAGAGLVVFAALYGQASWHFAQAEPRYHDLVLGKPATVVELDALTQALRASPQSSDLSSAAFVQMQTAQQVGVNSLRAITRLSAARRDLRLGLAAVPTDALAWTRLADNEARLGHPARAVAALLLGLELGPRDPAPAAMQFDLALVLWTQFDLNAKRAIERRLQWAQGRPDLKSVVADRAAVAIQQRLISERSDP
jgi:hypothetical protein